MRYIFITILFFSILLQLTFAQGTDEYKRGIAYEAKDNYISAVDMFSKAIELNKNNQNYFIKRGTSYYELGQYDNAISDFNAANKILINSANYYLARCYAAKGDIKTALKYLEENLKGRDKIFYYEVVKDRVFYDFLETSEWIDFRDRVWYDEFEKTLNEAGFLMNSHDFYDAIEYLDNAILNKMKGAELFALRAECYNNLENYSNAIEDYTLAIQHDLKNYEYYNSRAELYILTDKPKKAIEDYRMSIKIENNQIPVYFKLAELENAEELYPEAAKSIQTYINFNPEDMDALYLGGVIYRNNGEIIKALGYLNKLIEITPSKAEYFEARGETYMAIDAQDYLQFAINDFSMALDLKPNANSYLKRAKANYKYRKYNEACFDIEQAINLGSLEAVTLKDAYCANSK